MARNSTLARRISAGFPSTLPNHQGCQTSFRTTKPGSRAVNLNLHLSVPVGGKRDRGAGKRDMHALDGGLFRRHAVEQHSLCWIEVRPASVRDHLVEVGRHPPRSKNDAGKGARIFVDVAVGRLGHELQIAQPELLVEGLDGPVDGDVAEPQQVGHCRAVGREQWREHPLPGLRNGFGRAYGLHRFPKPHGIIAKHVIEIMDEADIGPFKAEANQFDAVAPSGICRASQMRPQKRHGAVLGVGAQLFILRGRHRC